MSKKKKQGNPLLQSPWVGLEPDLTVDFGGIYLMTDLTSGCFYVGRKQFWKKRYGIKGCKTALAAPGSPKWKAHCWVQTDWKNYGGSSNSWTAYVFENPDHEYERRFIAMCPTKGALNLAEAYAITSFRGLTDPRCFNKALPSIKFRVRPDIWGQVRYDEVYFQP